MTDLSDRRICFVGDSFVNGTSDPSCLGWTGRVCAHRYRGDRPLTYYNLGIRRETSQDIEQRWQAEVARRLPESCEGRVVFAFGTNDTTWEQGKTRVEVSASITAAKSILTIAQRLYPTLMISPAPIADAEQNCRTADLSQHLQQLCQTLDIPYLDVFRSLQQSQIWMQEVVEGDGAHPGAAGYAEYANLVHHWSGWQDWFKD